MQRSWKLFLVSRHTLLGRRKKKCTKPAKYQSFYMKSDNNIRLESMFVCLCVMLIGLVRTNNPNCSHQHPIILSWESLVNPEGRLTWNLISYKYTVVFEMLTLSKYFTVQCKMTSSVYIENVQLYIEWCWGCVLGSRCFVAILKWRLGVKIW